MAPTDNDYKKMLKQIKIWVDSRWFSLVYLLIVAGSGAIWYIRPELGWKILLIALFPWVIRVAAGYTPFRRTVFDIPILIFLLSALLGVQVAFDLEVSWAKFWLIVAGVLCFYALAAQPRENTWLVVQIMTGVGVAISIFFLLVYDWQTHPVRNEVINRVGQAWMKVRPAVQYTLNDDDILSNLLLVLFPYPVALFLHARANLRQSRWWLIFATFSTAIYIIGLCMAALMEAVCVFVVAAVFTVWWMISRLLEQKGFPRLQKIFLICTGVVVLLGLFLIVRFPEEILFKMKGFSGFSHYEDRITVIINTL